MKQSAIFITSLGNLMEWLDFGLFLFMAPVIGAAFFPQHNSAFATMDAFMVFAAGFICRPLGGVILGHFGDTIGRAKTLRVSILLITLSTCLVGFVPSYQTAGILAPILFTLLRLIQGISIGGEFSGVMIYLAESAPAHRRGFITSFAATGANLGFLLATFSCMLFNHFATTSAIADWAWRVPFIVAGLPGSIIFYYRFKLTETNQYQRMRTRHQLVAHPFSTVIKSAPRQLLKIIGLTCMSSTFYYAFFGYMPYYLNHYMGFSLNHAFLLQTVMLILMLGFVPLSGLCGDRLTRKTMLIITAIGIIGLSVPCFYGLQTANVWMIGLALIVAMLLSSMDQGNSLTAVVENCPENLRYSGIAFSYNLGTALFGGTAPFMVSWLTEQFNPSAPAYYLMGMACISLLAACFLLGKNRYVPAVTLS